MKNFLVYWGPVIKYALIWWFGISISALVIFPIINDLVENGLTGILILIVALLVVGWMTKKVLEYKGDGSEFKDM